MNWAMAAAGPTAPEVDWEYVALLVELFGSMLCVPIGLLESGDPNMVLGSDNCEVLVSWLMEAAVRSGSTLRCLWSCLGRCFASRSDCLNPAIQTWCWGRITARYW